MKLHLNDLWTLTDEHSASSHGKPVLIELETRKAHGPGDLIKLNPSGRAVPGYIVARAMVEGTTFPEDELEFIDQFII